MRRKQGQAWVDDGPQMPYVPRQGLGAVPLSAAQPVVVKAWPAHSTLRWSRTAEAQRAYRARRRAQA